jgi:hypothetical protein
VGSAHLSRHAGRLFWFGLLLCVKEHGTEAQNANWHYEPLAATHYSYPHTHGHTFVYADQPKFVGFRSEKKRVAGRTVLVLPAKAK